MIVLFFGQPASGKTTLADAFISALKDSEDYRFVRIDGDKWRDLTQNRDYTKEGRIANLTSAFNMAKYLDNEGFTPVLSFVTPYKSLRDLLQNGNKCQMVHLHYLQMIDDRGRSNLFAKDFEIPQDCLSINTSLTDIVASLELVVKEFLRLNENTTEEAHCQDNHI